MPAVELRKLEGRKVRLPFTFFQAELTAPASSSATRYEATATAVGSVVLKPKNKD